ncbi:Lnb N-terminal periplasmic domain-containing protein [Pseudochrobactrum sp. HB0163]|uniref:Lnb N-terminal periplasmic domain-containing protein n=1 Tax=Pseudochrobactrum sp. HB0163 TaxID=3450708 RepID=UPI003F6DCA8B
MAKQTSLTLLNFLARALISLLVLIITLWGSFAFYYQLQQPPALTGFTTGLWVLTALAAFSSLWFAGLRQYRTILFLLFAGCFILLLIWWHSIKPSLDRDWEPEVSQTVTAEDDGNLVRLKHIRDFDWRTEHDYTARWKSADYDLDKITSVDLFLSYWSSPAIAHTLVSFGFEDGRHIVFSAEIRKKRGQAFSEIGGFFKDFELAMIAAEESDIIYLRTNVRGERVYRYRVDIAKEQAQKLFRLYTDTANRLSKTPAFYNTLTANCTTVVFDMARMLDPSIAMDYRVLLSGYLPEYMFEKQLIITPETNAHSMRLNASISTMAEGGREGYSQRIRTEPAQ